MCGSIAGETIMRLLHCTNTKRQKQCKMTDGKLRRNKIKIQQLSSQPVNNN
jgi:hypothetical protein